MSYGHSRFYKKPPSDKDIFVAMNIHIPKSLYDKISKLSRDNMMPRGRYIMKAIYNEFQQAVPFAFDDRIPEEPVFIEQQYVNEASKLLKWMLENTKGGIGLDLLILCKDDIGLDEITLKLAFRELLAAGMVRAKKPSRLKFDYHPDYVTFQPVSEETKLKPKKFQTELERIEKVKAAREARKKAYDKIPLKDV